MRNKSDKSRLCTGAAPRAITLPAITLLEMVIALAIMTIIFAAVVPQFRVINNSWDSKQGNAEVLQNGRVLIDHITRNLSKAVKITAVSDSSETNGFIEFEDNDGNSLRYDIAANNYVEFGPVGGLSDLAGPVSTLQFTCYDGNDFESATTDVNSIRFVNVQTILPNPAAIGQDKTFTTWVYLRANGNNQTQITKGTPFEYNTSRGTLPALAQIDSTHCLCAYDGPGSDGWAVVLMVDTDNSTVSNGTAFEFDSSEGSEAALAKIDDNHYLCAYRGPDNDGWAVVLTVDTGNWTISKGTAFEFDDSEGREPTLAKIDNNHYLCAYRGPDNDGWAVVLTVDTGNWTISKGTAFEYDSSQGTTPALAQIDSTHFLCAYTGPGSDGWSVVLTVDTGNWTISKETGFEYDSAQGASPSLVQIDSTHYLCAYEGSGSDGWVVVLIIDTGSWTISKATAFEYDNVEGVSPALAQIDSNRYFCAFTGPNSDGWTVVLTVDTTNFTISIGLAFEYDNSQGTTPALAEIDSDNYLCAYTGPGSDGWSVILKPGDKLRP